MVDVPDTLGIRIRQARREAGYRNIETLAVRMGVGMSTVHRWETDKSEPSIRRLRQIAALTGKPLGYFLAAVDGAAA